MRRTDREKKELSKEKCGLEVAMERLVIRHLYHRPLETLLATFGISIALQQASTSRPRCSKPAHLDRAAARVVRQSDCRMTGLAPYDWHFPK